MYIVHCKTLVYNTSMSNDIFQISGVIFLLLSSKRFEITCKFAYNCHEELYTFVDSPTKEVVKSFFIGSRFTLILKLLIELSS